MGGSESKAIAAVRRGALEDLELLGEDAAAGVDGNGCTPLILACKSHEKACAFFLAQHRLSDVHAVDADGATALLYAVPHASVVAALLSRGADPNIKTASSRTPLTEAAHGGHVQSLRLLLEHGADPSVESARGTALKIARAAAASLASAEDAGAVTQARNAWLECVRALEQAASMANLPHPDPSLIGSHNHR